ncbi:MAG TPA: hypothetical protein DCO77_11535 [Nitrospiraceae bacterium]|nr:hypothetical protein [Nitrospiraceae bacterium]
MEGEDVFNDVWHKGTDGTFKFTISIIKPQIISKQQAPMCQLARDQMSSCVRHRNSSGACVKKIEHC